MKWSECWSRLRYIWLVGAKQAVQEVGMIQFMSGTFDRDYQEGKNKIIESITIRQISAISNVFSVKRLVCRQLSIDEKTLSKADEWMAVYDHARRQLLEVAGDRQCTFIPEDAIVFVNAQGYKKVQITAEQ